MNVKSLDTRELKFLNIYCKDKISLDSIELNKSLELRYAPLISCKLRELGETGFEREKTSVIFSNLVKLKELNWIDNQVNFNIVLLKNETIYNIEDYIRGSSDIDIYVEPKNLKKIRHILSIRFEVIQKNKKNAFDGLYQETWVSKNNEGIILDLHWHLSYPILFPFEKIDIERIEKSKNIYLLKPELRIIHLITHIIKDVSLFHYSILDICHIINTNEINHKILIQKAIENNCLSGTYLIFWIMKDLDDKTEELRQKIIKTEKYKSYQRRLPVVQKIQLLKKRKIKQFIYYYLLTDSVTLYFRFISNYIKKSILLF